MSVAHTVADDRRDPVGFARLAACYDLATDALGKLGAPTRRITADRATAYARLSGSQVAMASAARHLSVVLRHEGQHALADRVTAEAADHLESIGLTIPAEAAMYAQMLCTCAYNAAHAGDRERSLNMIADAERAAARLHAPHGQPVTPASVALYRVGVHWSLGDTGAALRAGRRLHPGQFPTAERRGRLHTDMARVWQQAGRPEETARALLAAYREAPDEIHRPSILRIVTDLTRHHPRTPGVRRLAAVASRTGHAGL
ncbi:hypothetical protein AB0I81_44335 [Nonomuraea sp. NPDC050404]|uniref:hypothetical protein n=1 Tax=Nonomuraea sp. NPDC050404 TaxID=3155783 RepID=UPI0033F40C50